MEEKEVEEIWRKIPNFSRYEVSNLGRIRSMFWNGGSEVKVMKLYLGSSGYLRTALKSDGGKYICVKPHRAVALAFHENPKNHICVNHIDGVKTNNHVDNLEWCTHGENSKHAFKIGLKTQKGEYNSNASLTDEQVLEIRANYKYGKTQREGETKQQIAEKYGTTFSVIKRVIQGKTWKHLL